MRDADDRAVWQATFKNNRLTKLNGQEFSYDAWGNITSKRTMQFATDWQLFEYDAENRLVHTQHWLGPNLASEGWYQEAIGVRGALLGGALGAKGGRWFDARYEVQAKGLGANLGNIKVSKKPLSEDVQKEKVSPEVYDKLRKRTPSTAIRKMVNKGVNLPMKDPALPGMEITKSLHADHIQPMKSIMEMDGFAKLRFEDQVAVLNHEPNFVGLSEVANTAKGAQSFTEWTGYKKGNIAVDPAFKAGMIERSEALKPEIQQLIYDKLSKY